MKNFIPTFHATNIYEVDPVFFKEQGVETLLLDLDNTLASYRATSASDRTKSYLAALAELGISLFIISNNKGPRVESYAASVNLPFLASARKPFIKRIKSFLSTNDIDVKTLMFVGDQLLTDVLVANKLGARVLLCEKLVAEDQWTTKFNRLIDRPLRRKLRRKSLLREWNDGRRT